VFGLAFWWRFGDKTQETQKKSALNTLLFLRCALSFEVKRENQTNLQPSK
jgi:hypothetical protein